MVSGGSRVYYERKFRHRDTHIVSPSTFVTSTFDDNSGNRVVRAVDDVRPSVHSHAKEGPL